jgi:hypothetical protein
MPCEVGNCPNKHKTSQEPKGKRQRLFEDDRCLGMWTRRCLRLSEHS